jgi:hypothetical protein
MTTVLGACLGMSLLAGCSPADLDGAVAGQLQTRVAAAKQLAAAQDFPAALAELQQLNLDVAAAAEQGKVSQDRKTRIEAAISAIRGDLEAAITPAPAPTAPATDRPLSEEERKQLEEAQKEAEKQQEEAQEEAEKQQEEAEKDKGKGKD